MTTCTCSAGDQLPGPRHESTCPRGKIVWTEPSQPLSAGLNAIEFLLATQRRVKKSDIRMVIRMARDKALRLEWPELFDGRWNVPAPAREGEGETTP